MIAAPSRASACAQILVVDVRQGSRRCARPRPVRPARATCAGAPQRRLAQRQAIDRAPAEKAVDALADHVGEMLNLDRRRALDPQHQRARLGASSPTGRARPLDFHRLAVGGDFGADDLAPARHQFGRGKALPGKASRRRPCRRGRAAAWRTEREGLFMLRGSVIPRPGWAEFGTIGGQRPAQRVRRDRSSEPAARQRAHARGDFIPATRRLARLVRPPSPRLPWRRRRASAPIPTASGCRKSCCSRPTVKAVAPYFARFLARWPDVARARAAPLDDVLKAWAGLGYYARARNLHACARAVVERHGGEFPASEGSLRALPGIGAYTAAAIAAIAFERRTDAGRRQYRARGGAAVRGRGAAAGGQAADRPAAPRALAPHAPRRRFRAGDDGSRRHDLHAEEAGLRAVSVERWLRGARAAAIRRPFRADAPSAKARCAAAPPSSSAAPTALCWCARARRRACSAA